MTFTALFVFFLVLQGIHFLATWRLYVKAGRKSWEALVPIYNAVVLMKMINRPTWWTILLFIPIVNLLMFPIVWVESCRSFGHNKNHDTLLAIATLGFYLFYINYFSENQYIKERSLQPKTALGEWVSSIAFAIIAATLVHTYFMQPYTIPTSSLEKTLYVGDFLFVSKFHYGARVPMTAVAAPMVHDTLPFVGKSYVSDSKDEQSWLNKLSLPYMRVPGIQKIKRNDIVVFSWPADSLNYMWGDKSGNFTYKPIDKRTNYVKRCVGIPGDSLEVRDGYVYINGKRTVLPDRAKPQYIFSVNTGGKQFSRGALQRYNIREAFWGNDGRLKTDSRGNFILNLTDEEAALIAKNPIVKSITKNLEPKGKFDKNLFPHSPLYRWSQDNYGPIYIPKKGDVVELNQKSIPFYEQLIRRYEGNNFNVVGNNYYLNGKKITKYTIKQDYYWMMGDNRQNSLDARSWGYVPFDHVVGKPVLIWLSWDPNAPNFMAKLKSIRWDRMFTTVGGSGEPVSYFKFFLIALVGYFVVNYYRKKKKSA
ncbi:MAG: signal peptidase I [Flavobacteriaceae bacterium]|nr:signal peptidase I [Flavobacteriaceae bacterium]